MPPRLKSLFSSVLWKVYNQIPLTLKARFPGDSQSLCPGPGLASLTWGSEPSQQQNFFGGIVLQLVGHPPLSMGFDFIVIVYHLLSCFFFVFGCGVSYFGGFQCPPRMMVVQQLVAVLVLLQEEMSTRPSTLPSCLAVEVLYIFWILTPH